METLKPSYSTEIMNLQRRYPIGAEVQSDGGTHFRVWAFRPKKVEVLLKAGPGAPDWVSFSTWYTTISAPTGIT